MQPLKPKLTRKLVSKAKINLNKYWNKFEELLSNAENDIKTFSAASYRAFSPDNKPAKLPLLASMNWEPPQNNVQDEINSLMSKSFDNDEPSNYNSSDLGEEESYTTFTDEELYYGVNLNATPRPQRHQALCACCQLQMSPSAELNTPRFSHRNIQLTFEDCQNLENEAMEVYTNFGYLDTSF